MEKYIFKTGHRNTLTKIYTLGNSTKFPDFFYERERDRIRESEKTEKVMENIKLTRYLMILRSDYLIILGLVMVLYLSS